MTWSERIKYAWATFTREVLPLYGSYLIFLVVNIIFFIALAIGVVFQLRWSFFPTFDGSVSPGMPVPGVPPAPDVTPFAGLFGSHNKDLLPALSRIFSNSTMLQPAIISLAITLLIFLIVFLIIVSAYYCGVFNLTAKAYREKATFADFRFSGFLRILGWQGFILLITLVIFIIEILGIFLLHRTQGALLAFLIIYNLLLIVIGLYLLPWLSTAFIYLFAHRQEGFLDALKGSWGFFQRHMGALWGYIGTIFLIMIAIQVINHFSHFAGGLANLVVSPFITVLGIVWVLSLEDRESEQSYYPPINPAPHFSNPNPETPAPDAPLMDHPIADSQIDTPAPISEEQPEISLQKIEPLPPSSEDKP